MSSHSISASVIYKKRTEAQNRALQDVQNEFVESRREETRLQEELLRKEKPLQDTQVRSKHEMGKMKRAQVQQFDEFSMQNHETIQQLTSQLHQMQEQMNSIRGHFGSSHFLFERARCFSRSRAFLVLSCPSVCNPVLQFPSFSHGTCERWNRCASISGTSLLFEYGFS